MKNLKTQGIILKAMNYGDYDQILTMLSRDYGKIKVMARGVRRGKSKLRGGCQVYSFVQTELYKGKNFYRLIQSSSVKSFIEIRESYAKLLAASEWAEVLDKTTIEEERDEELFRLALSGFTYLAFEETLKTLRVFEAKLLHKLGYLGAKLSCSHCQREDVLYFTSRGDCLCPECVKVKTDLYLDKAAQKVLTFFIEEDFEQIRRLKVGPGTLLLIGKFLHNQISCSLGKDLKIFTYPDDSIDIKT